MRNIVNHEFGKTKIFEIVPFYSNNSYKILL